MHRRVIARAYGYAKLAKAQSLRRWSQRRAFGDAVNAGDVAQVRRIVSRAARAGWMDRPQAMSTAPFTTQFCAAIADHGAPAHGSRRRRPPGHLSTSRRDHRFRSWHETASITTSSQSSRKRSSHRRESMSCSNATVSPGSGTNQLRDLTAATSAHAIHLLESDTSLIDACDRDGGTPLHVAAWAKSMKLVAWLLKPARQRRQEHDPNGLTPLDHAALAADPRNDRAERFPRVAAMLIEHGAELTLRAAVALGDGTRCSDSTSRPSRICCVRLAAAADCSPSL